MSYVETETDIAPRHTVETLFQAKLRMLAGLARLEAVDAEIRSAFASVGGFAPYRVDYRFYNYDSGRASGDADLRAEHYVDRTCWRNLTSLFFLERYLLCTEYEKMRKEVDEFRTPVFTVENANAWLAGLKDLINDNVRVLVKQVYRSVIDGTYRTGTSYRDPKKKRNNNGVDKRFILSTNDHQMLFAYWSSSPTITDDLEKVCYLLDGKTVPEKTAKETMKETKSPEYECEYFSLKLCANGNTHYVLSDETRNKLNLYGPEGATIGENIKIKIFRERWTV